MNDIKKWKALSTQLKMLKKTEADLRRQICASIIGHAEIKNGRITVKATVEGQAVKAVQTLSYNLDEASLGSVWEALTETEKAVIKLKPTLKLGQYKKLPEDSLLHEAVTSKLAMPTLEVGE